MADFIVQTGLSNACFSLVLAIAAMAVGTNTKRPQLAHLLWLLVFVKLVTPPLVSVPVFSITEQPEPLIAVQLELTSHLVEPAASGPLWAAIGALIVNYAVDWLPRIWLAGCVFVFIVSLVRIYRFHHLLLAESKSAEDEMQAEATTISRRLGLKTTPTVYTTSARLSPMVWWVGGKVRVVIPNAIIEQMDAAQWRWVLAHELAHVHRRDHFVRWLEWLVCVCFWWNPVVWWAQRNLRAMEEICCDALVLSSLNPKPNDYANSLLKAVEFFASPVVRPPAMASEINSGGYLERRFKMIVSNTALQSPRWMKACVLLAALVVLPLSVSFAQDYEAVGMRLGKAVKKGEITERQADIMLHALREAGGKSEQEDERVTEYRMVERRIRAAVEEGDITREDAQEKLIEIRNKMFGDHDIDERKEKFHALESEIRQAVRKGDLSREEAEEKLIHIRKELFGDTQGREREEEAKMKRWREVEKRIDQSVERGDLTKSQARKKMIEMKEQIFADDQKLSEHEEQLEANRLRLRRAVEAAELTREEADEKLKGLRQRLEMAERRDEKRSVGESDLEGIWKRLQTAVQQGKMTQEEAEAKISSMRIKAHLEGVWNRLQIGVKEGKLTQEKANARMAALKKEMHEKTERGEHHEEGRGR